MNQRQILARSHTILGAFEAKTKFSELLERVRRGEEITITRHEKPIARLVPVEKPAFGDVAEAFLQMEEISRRTPQTDPVSATDPGRTPPMNRLTLDASIALSWFLPGEHHETNEAVRKRIEGGIIRT